MLLQPLAHSGGSELLPAFAGCWENVPGSTADRGWQVGRLQAGTVHPTKLAAAG